jgi:hypothetical protein
MTFVQTPALALLPLALDQLNAAAPNLQVEVVQMETAPAVEALRSRAVDLVVGIEYEPVPVSRHRDIDRRDLLRESVLLTVHLDAGYDYQPCRQALAARGMLGQIATRGVPAPIQASRRWPVERTHAWGNQYGKLRWCTERRRLVVAFWLALANAVIVCGRLVRRAWTCYRWEHRPRRP